jgi:hypothetical protein
MGFTTKQTVGVAAAILAALFVGARIMVGALKSDGRLLPPGAVIVGN